MCQPGFDSGLRGYAWVMAGTSTRPDARRRGGPATEVEKLARRATRTLDPEEGLRAVSNLRERLEDLEVLHVSNALGAGRSWGDIGRALGITRQAAHKRYATRAAANGAATGSQPRMLVTAEARRAVAQAREEARALGVAVVGTEHLLMGILRCERSPAARALRALGARLGDARSVAEPTMAGAEGDGMGDEPAGPAWKGMSPHARRVLERSLQEALDRGEGYIGVEHLLLAVVRDERSGAAQTLARMEIDPAELASAVASL